MSNLFVQNIIGMDVSSTNGIAIGSISSITMNFKTGQLSNLVIEPNRDSKTIEQLPIDESGHIQIPITKVKAVNDHLIVNVDTIIKN
ncbi:PRC-barrel domain-containing protein [Haladaptatus caseinilyticus]|uniref:PRC-barrel domain-containing protein n=1 Tax=Haladaptatus caseinilyticus TaxID=2993314 RepID=UPI00224AE08D|nr:PRC-barrel domain-containing protein [Haladaptatus caseinilyticus]